MRLLLPMAYAFLTVVSDEKSRINSEITTVDDNLTYRLMEFERKKENGDPFDSMTLGASSANQDPSVHIVPRRRTPQYQSAQVDTNTRTETSEFSRENALPPSTIKPKDRSLDEFEEEIAKFRIASGVKRKIYPKKKKRQEPPPQSPIKDEKKTKNAIQKEMIKKVPKKEPKKPVKKEAKKESKNKTKQKPVLEELDEALNFDFENEGHEGDGGEEEETEEKKEKIHKVTFKKKTPYKNTTKIIRHQRQQPLPVYQIPYKTIIKEKEKIFTQKLTKPKTEMMKVSSKPLIQEEVVETLNPIFHQDKNVHKDVKTRDVNVFLKTRAINPKILIRRYKPMFSVINIPIIKGKNSALKKQHRKQRRKQRRRRKKQRDGDEDDVDEDFSPESSRVAKKVSCSSERPPSLPPSPPSAENFATSNAFPVFGSMSGHRRPYEGFSSPFQNYRPEPVNIPEEGIPFSDEYQQYPSASFSAMQQLPAAKSMAAIKTERVVADEDEPVETEYDILGHKNTEALAAVHEKETDDTVDNEEEEPHFPDASVANDPGAEIVDDGENAEAEPVTSDDENEEGESSPQWKLIYRNQPQKLVKQKRYTYLAG